MSSNSFPLPTTNRGVVYQGPGIVTVENIPFPKLYHDGQNRPCPHGAIIKCIATNICGSDQHMVHGRTTASTGMILGHEITGEVIQVGPEVEFIKVGDIVSVPFNIACGKCFNCKGGLTNICLNVNPKQPGGIYGYVDMGGWVGGQAEYVMTPYADFNLLKLPPKEKSLPKIKDLALLSDVLPTGFHGAVTAGVQAGSTVYVAGAGPIGLACAASCFLLGAACVIVGDQNEERLQQARKFGCKTANLSSKVPLADQVYEILGEKEVDAAVECVGYEAYGCGHCHTQNVPNQAINDVMEITKAGGGVGVPGFYAPEDPGAPNEDARYGKHTLKFATGWNKGLTIANGQCPVMKYHKPLLNAIMHDRLDIAKAVNVTVISLDDAPQGYKDFDSGVAKKFVIDPHGMIPK